MEVVGVHVARAVAPNGDTVIRVVLDGKDGASVVVDLANTVHPEDDPKAIERAKNVLIEAARYKSALNDYDAQSNGNFDEISIAEISDGNEDQMYIYEYRDGAGSTQTPPSRMPSLKAARGASLSGRALGRPEGERRGRVRLARSRARRRGRISLRHRRG